MSSKAHFGLPPVYTGHRRHGSGPKSKDSTDMPRPCSTSRKSETRKLQRNPAAPQIPVASAALRLRFSPFLAPPFSIRSCSIAASRPHVSPLTIPLAIRPETPRPLEQETPAVLPPYRTQSRSIAVNRTQKNMPAHRTEDPAR